jgi:hypothetical protein
MESLAVIGRRKLAVLGLCILSSLFFGGTSVSAVQSVTLAWNASADTNVVGYNVYYGTSSGAYTSKIDVGGATNATINNLTEGVTYYFAATAYNIIGLESDYSAEVSYTVPVPAGNQAPTLNTIAGLTIPEDSTQQTVTLSGISSGSASESQTLTVTATSSNTGLIPNPTVNYASPNATGSLSFTPIAGASGSAVITVTVNDGQATNNTISRTFTVTVVPVNDVPTLNALSNLTLVEDAGLQTVSLAGISSGAANENQTLTVTASSSNTGLIPNPTVTYTSPNATGTLSFTPVANASGSATITVSVNDGGTSNNIVSKTFTVTVNALNDVPTLGNIPDLAINEDAAQQTVSLSGISSGAANESQTLTVSASSSNTGLIPNPTVAYTSPNATGTLTFKPVTNAFGSATITVTVNDGGTSNNVVSKTFIVTVNSVNDTPTLGTLGNLSLSENASQQTVNLSGIGSGTANESQTLTVTATSSNTGLIPNPTVTYTSPNATGTLAFQPVMGASGSATISVTVNDGGTSNNIVTRTFTVTVTAGNLPPTLNPIGNLTINVNAGLQTVNLSGISSGSTNENQTLTVAANSSNTGVIPNPTVSYTSPGSTGKLTFTPVAQATGSSTITVTVNDGAASNNIVSRTFTVTLNSAPTITVIPNQTIAVSSNTGPVSFTIGDVETVSTALTVFATSSQPALIPTNNIVFGGSGANRTVTLTPIIGQTGTANITVTVSDGFATASTTFQLNVLGAPAAPTTLTVITNGLGSISGASVQSMTAGKVYTLTAMPAEGQEFVGWSGSLSSTSTKISFVARSSVVLQATFVPSPYRTGSYNGLFHEEGQVRLPSSGSFNVVVTKHGVYSGRLQMGKTKYSFTGKFDLQCRATNTITRTMASPLILRLQLGTNDLADQITGQLTDGAWTAVLNGDRAIFGKTNAAPFAGTYTLVLPPEDGNASAPEGHGYATVKVNTTGLALLSGVLADGMKLTQSAPLSKDGVWPVYASPYSTGGAALGWLHFTNRSNDDLNGSISWIKSGSALAKFYPAGFDTESEATGSKFVATPGTNVLNASTGEIEFKGGNLPGEFSNQIQIAFNNQVSNLGTNALSLVFSPTTGAFKGKVTDLSGISRTFAGAMLQKSGVGYGFLLGTNLSSRVTLNY